MDFNTLALLNLGKSPSEDAKALEGALSGNRTPLVLDSTQSANEPWLSLQRKYAADKTRLLTAMMMTDPASRSAYCQYAGLSEHELNHFNVDGSPEKVVYPLHFDNSHLRPTLEKGVAQLLADVAQLERGERPEVPGTPFVEAVRSVTLALRDKDDFQTRLSYLESIGLPHFMMQKVELNGDPFTVACRLVSEFVSTTHTPGKLMELRKAAEGGDPIKDMDPTHVPNSTQLTGLDAPLQQFRDLQRHITDKMFTDRPGRLRYFAAIGLSQSQIARIPYSGRPANLASKAAQLKTE